MYRVLITDDEPISRLLIKSLIDKHEDFVVCYEADNANDAIEICKKNPVDIVFMDIMLPGQSGIYAAKEINKVNKSISIFVISAYRSFVLAEMAIKFNAGEFISKPITEASMNMILERYKLENAKMNSEVLYKLLDNAKNGNFIECQSDIKELSAEIMATIHEKNAIKNHILNLGNVVYDAMVSSDSYRDGFINYLKEEILENRRLHDCSLFFIVDYCFKIKSIMNCPILENIFNYIEKNIESEISLKNIVDDCAISQGYLSRIFKKEFNTTVMTYIHLKKINIAKRLIFNENFSVSDAAFKLSYNEGNYFSKVFKKYEGLTVEQYRCKMI